MDRSLLDLVPDPDEFFENVLAFAMPGRADAIRRPADEWQRWWRSACPDTPLGLVAARQGFVVTTAQAASFGYSRSAMRTAVARGRWYAPQRGIVAPVSVAGDDVSTHTVARRKHALAATAAVLENPDQVITGRSGAIVHGLPTREIPDRPEVTDRADGRLGTRGARHRYGAAIGAESIGSWFGAPLSVVPRTLVDLGRHDRGDALMAADAALRQRLVQPADFDVHLAAATGWPGVRQARAVLALASPKAESPLESLVRLAVHDAGLPAPELQVWIAGFRIDMLWPGRRLVLEVDGMEKYTAAERRREQRRERALRLHGYVIERVSWDDLTFGWPETLERLRPLILG